MNSKLAAARLPGLAAICLIASIYASAASAVNGGRVDSGTDFDSRLWQREYSPDQNFQSAAVHVAAEAGRRAALAKRKSETENPASAVAVVPVAESELADNAATELREAVPVAITLTQTDALLQQAVLFDAADHRMATEWDKAIAMSADGNRDPEGLASGPTLTTYLVTVVAAIVVLGCTLSPS